jgi:hypothetical protein
MDNYLWHLRFRVQLFEARAARIGSLPARERAAQVRRGYEAECRRHRKRRALERAGRKAGDLKPQLRVIDGGL